MSPIGEDFAAVNWSSVTTTASTDDSCIYDQSEAVNFYRFVTNGLLINIIGLLGLLGNIISMIILSRPQMRSSINYLLIGLARIDTVLIITSMLLFGLPGIYPYCKCLFTYYFIVYPHITTFVFPLAMVTQTASVYLTITVSLERFVAVCHPLRARSLCTYGRARIYVIGIVIFSVMYNLPRLWEGRVQKYWHKEYNVTIYCPQQSSFRDNILYQTIYIHWMYLICMYLLPFGSLAVLNACIYRQVAPSEHQHQPQRSVEQDERVLKGVAQHPQQDAEPWTVRVLSRQPVRQGDMRLRRPSDHHGVGMTTDGRLFGLSEGLGRLPRRRMRRGIVAKVLKQQLLILSRGGPIGGYKNNPI